MPPRRNIVRSGNAGNSSKSAKPTPVVDPGKDVKAGPTQPEKKLLFPPGSKTPLALLNERCQKNGWEKPIVDAKRAGGGYTCVVTLRRMNKKSAEMESVRMEPHPPLSKPTAEEARHWGAVYALYRFANNIQLNVVLPPEPRKYWADLAEEHKKAPDHQTWQYSPDPFAARKVVDDRQAVAKDRQDERQALQAEAVVNQNLQTPLTVPKRDLRGGSREFEKAPEVRMATSLRESVEAAIKKTISLFPDSEMAGFESANVLEIDVSTLRTQLQTLGFKPQAISQVIALLSAPPPYDSYLTSLHALAPLDAALSHLLVTTNEADLPKAFLDTRAQTSSGGFIASMHSTTEDLATRWIREKAVKVAGWPEKAVRTAMEGGSVNSWEVLMEVLGRKLVGLEELEPEELEVETMEERDLARQEEVDAVQSVFANAAYDEKAAELSIPIPDTAATLHIIYAAHHPYPSAFSPRAPPMYITGPTIVPYIRLHLLAQLLASIYDDDVAGDSLRGILEAATGIAFSAVELLTAAWQESVPDVGEVMKFLLPPPPAPTLSAPVQITSASGGPAPRGKSGGSRNMDPRSDRAVLEDFDMMRNQKGYEGILEQRQRLPAWDSRDTIVELIGKNRVVIVVGETGCGKTTQLPQFILDSLIASNKGKSASIMITQPRRVSALGVAARVSSERMDDGSVGYAIRGDSKATPRTKLLFVTTGVALRRLAMEEGRMLAGVSHVVVDEVHERSVDSDFFLLELRELLKRNKTIKVILMSATINQKTFVDYFGGAPVLEIPGFTHPVKDIYLEDVIGSINYRAGAPRQAEKRTKEQSDKFRDKYRGQGLDDAAITSLENIVRSGRIDYQLVAAVVNKAVSQAAKPQDAVLIFMPGVQEISSTIEAMRSIPGLSNQVDVLPLHANLTVDEQKRVFKPTTKRKVVVATNVAETSITIPDVVFVVDSGRVKETSYDTASGLSKLAETWVTKAAARQRRGRAGRTQPGQCFKLYTREQEDAMGDFPVPEILRVPLDALSLQVKAAREDEDVKTFLAKAIDPPKVEAMADAWRTLENLGAIDENGKLMALGRHMSMLPLDIRLSKMLILGAIFRCLSPLLTIAAVLSSKPLFFSPPDKREEAKQARQRFARSNSDLLTDAQAYAKFSELRSSGRASQQRFCDENFISPSTVRDITSLRTDFYTALASIGFVPLRPSDPDAPALNVHSGNDNLVKAVICGGLWPRVVRVSQPKQVFDRVQAGTVERDHESKEYKVFEAGRGGERVFVHPQSVLFDKLGSQRSPFFVYFAKGMTSKVFLRDMTEVPMYGVLLFGGKVTVNHIAGGLMVGGDDGYVKMKAWPRIGVLVNQLRRLLDAQLSRSLDEATISDMAEGNAVMEAMLALLENDGLSGI